MVTVRRLVRLNTAGARSGASNSGEDTGTIPQVTTPGGDWSRCRRSRGRSRSRRSRRIQ